MNEFYEAFSDHCINGMLTIGQNVQNRRIRVLVTPFTAQLTPHRALAPSTPGGRSKASLSVFVVAERSGSELKFLINSFSSAVEISRIACTNL
jgi:hypothetical protein